MEELFRLEGTVYQILSKVQALLVLNFWLVVTSIPIITLGASQAAGFYVLTKIMERNDYRVSSNFWRAFVKNGRQCTYISFLLLILAGCLFVNTYYLTFVNPSIIILASSFVLLFCWLHLFQFVFYFVQRYEGSVIEHIRNSFKVYLQFPKDVLFIHLSYLIILCLWFVSPYWSLFITFFGLFIGSSVHSFIRYLVMRKISSKIEVRKEWL
ncbi:DUF624 domain-containing protein [Streptococcus cuniculi]|uniref:DUF624 domain-containing protein n=1 Tax=Streptococcus cuniculi TaxID=1432788 RepID=A0A4Y9JE87_9STRE|nr:DUF624 domain-containing protein [Streptococcus cuniculi]MBF0777697.1 DUF624 domain-containing protein [Streptococcus cuniculi]TFU98336.1 DUF624 domain-containing protein [Streptococcus cuniculi]